MPEIFSRETAKIYRFPSGGRAALGDCSAEPVDEFALRVPRAVLGSSWYHDAAIAEAEQSKPQKR